MRIRVKINNRGLTIKIRIIKSTIVKKWTTIFSSNLLSKCRTGVAEEADHLLMLMDARIPLICKEMLNNRGEDLIDLETRSSVIKMIQHLKAATIKICGIFKKMKKRKSANTLKNNCSKWEHDKSGDSPISMLVVRTTIPALVLAWVAQAQWKAAAPRITTPRTSSKMMALNTTKAFLAAITRIAKDN